MHNIPRPEHPRPDLYREDWLNLNGEWQFHEDYERTGRSRRLGRANAELDSVITVPFCRESVLSGIGHTDFCKTVWYRRAVTLPEGWMGGSHRVLLHIGASDYKTEVWVNGETVCNHTGGYVQFTADITRFLVPGENIITICADDDNQTGRQPAGKQSTKPESYGCVYTRTTGIWQTVWLERVPAAYIKSFKIYPNIHNSTVTVTASICGGEGEVLTASASYEGEAMGSASTTVCSGVASVTIPLSALHLWELGCGRLYDLTLTLGEDKVSSYFGMRSVEIKGGFLYLNGELVFQRLILDQGFYPDGIYTAPTDAELIADIDRSMAYGFNGARLHEKIFEPRFLYHCDRKGYMVWGEHANWGMDITTRDGWASFIPEWVECLVRDFNHPAIIGWCPLNETEREQDPDFLYMLATVTRSFDPTRAYIDASGWNHEQHISDFYDVHDYTQDVVAFRERYESMRRSGDLAEFPPNRFAYTTTFVSEFGGARWSENENSWGYGDAPKTVEEFVERFRGLCSALLDNPAIGGFCYTQLTDVEQEVNGLYTYDRVMKFDPAPFREVLGRKAACELEGPSVIKYGVTRHR